MSRTIARTKAAEKSKKRHSSRNLPAPAEAPLDFEHQRYGVFLESYDDEIMPIQLRECGNRFEAYGWREYWKMGGHVMVKMTVRPINANGAPIAEEAASEAVQND